MTGETNPLSHELIRANSQPFAEEQRGSEYSIHDVIISVISPRLSAPWRSCYPDVAAVLTRYEQLQMAEIRTAYGHSWRTGWAQWWVMFIGLGRDWICYILRRPRAWITDMLHKTIQTHLATTPNDNTCVFPGFTLDMATSEQTYPPGRSLP